MFEVHEDSMHEPDGPNPTRHHKPGTAMLEAEQRTASILFATIADAADDPDAVAFGQHSATITQTPLADLPPGAIWQAEVTHNDGSPIGRVWIEF